MTTTSPDRERLREIARTIWSWATARSFAGSDPFDGLNSRLLAPFLSRSRLLRLLVIQGVKRSPLDLRPLLRIPPGVNPKGLALFLDGIGDMPWLPDRDRWRDWLVDEILSRASRPDGSSVIEPAERHEGLSSRILSGPMQFTGPFGWGYHFPWQSRAFLLPPYYPTVVATSFVVDAMEASRHPVYPLVARGAAEFVYNNLKRREERHGICFSYSPRDDTCVFNASLFAAKILLHASQFVPERADVYRQLALRSGEYVLFKQRDDGSWIYGEADHWTWIDNLHTGFNLQTLSFLAERLGRTDWSEQIGLGLTFYMQRLVEPDGTARYFVHRREPLDAHTFAQTTITLVALGDLHPDALPLAGRVLNRAVAELWDERRGGFRYQRHRRYTNRTIHARWNQAWMFRAIGAYLRATEDGS